MGVYSELKARADAEDLSDIELMKVVFTGGVDRDGVPVVWVVGKNLPTEKPLNPDLDPLQRVFLHFVHKVDSLSVQPYVAVLFCKGMEKQHRPEQNWLNKVY